MELDEHAARGRRAARSIRWTHSWVRALAGVLGQVARDDAAGCPWRPGLAVVLGVPDAGGRHRQRRACPARPATARSSAGTARRRPGCQSSSMRCSRSARLSSHVCAAVAALEQHAGVAAGVQRAALAGHDHPDPLERLVAAVGQRDAVGLRPLAGRIVGVPDLRAVEGRGRRGDHAAAGRDRASRSRSARPANARHVTSNSGARARPRARTGPSWCPAAARSWLRPPVIAGSISTRSSAPTAVSSPPRSPFTNTLMWRRMAPRSSRIQPATAGCSSSRPRSSSSTVAPPSLLLGAAAGELPQGSVNADKGHRFLDRPGVEPKLDRSAGGWSRNANSRNVSRPGPLIE